MRVTKKQLVQTIQECDGVATAIARKLGVTQQAISKRIDQDEELRQACASAKSSLLDDAEHQLAKAVRSGSPWAIKFVLATLGKNRGYTTAQPAPGPPAPTAQVVLVMPDDGRLKGNIVNGKVVVA